MDTFKNQSTARLLGYKMKDPKIQSWFLHPKLLNSKVCNILDVCHKDKLMSNLLVDYNIICSDNNGCIKNGMTVH